MGNCFKSSDDKKTEMIIENEINKAEEKPTNEKKEAKFLDLLKKIAYPSPAMQKKINELEAFKYDIRSDLTYLDVSKADRTIDGEAYYGFMYFYSRLI